MEISWWVLVDSICPRLGLTYYSPQIYTEPSSTASVASTLSNSRALKVASLDIIWDPNKDTLVNLDSQTTIHNLMAFLEDLQEEPSVQGVYINISRGRNIDDRLWRELQKKLDV